MHSLNKHSYMQLNCKVNPRVINRVVDYARGSKQFDTSDLEPPFLRLASHQPPAPVQEVDLTRCNVGFGRWAIPKLIRELHSEDTTTVKQALNSLVDVLRHPEKAYQAIRLRMTDRLASLLLDTEYGNSERAFMCLGILATHAQGMEAIVASRTVTNNLADALRGRDSSVRLRAADTLMNLTQHLLALCTLVNIGFTELTVELIKDETEPAVLVCLLKALINLMYNEGKELAFEAGAFDLLINLMSHQDLLVVAAATMCMAKMAMIAPCQKLCTSVGLLKKLTDLLYSEDPGVQKGAAACITFTTFSVKAKKQARDLPRLQQRLLQLANAFAHPDLQLYCVKALTNISEHPDVRERMLKDHLSDIESIPFGKNHELGRWKHQLLDVVLWKPCSQN